MYERPEDIPEYYCEMCCECTYLFENGYCPYIEENKDDTGISERNTRE